MAESNLIKKSSRKYENEGREFTVTYELREHVGVQGSEHLIRVSLVEGDGNGDRKKTGCSVELTYLRPELGFRLFEIISGATEPVFPVHVSDIVRDQILGGNLAGAKTYF